MRQQILTNINKHINEADKLLVALSGGKDSIALLHVLKTLNLEVSACHCNFKLRGLQADEDEAFTKNFCSQLNIPYYCIQFETKKYAKEKHISTQMAARELRYSYFKELKRQHDFKFVLTAHHLNDNIETLLFNISKGTGPKGLMGIPELTDGFLRPMLGISLHEIVKYLHENKIEWREDASNLSNDYARNKIRNKVVPVLKEINLGLEKTMLINFERFSDFNSIFKAQLEIFEKTFVKHNSETIEINLSKSSQTPGINLILEEFLKPFGFNYTQIKTLLALEQSGKEIKSESHKIIFSKDIAYLTKIKSEVENYQITQLGCYEFENFTLEFVIQNNLDNISELKNPNLAFLDFEKIKWPLTIRPWKNGDKFKPFGLKGNKLISDFLSDLKLNPIKKNNQLIVESSGDILWVVGQRIHHDYGITKITKSLLKIIYKEKLS